MKKRILVVLVALLLLSVCVNVFQYQLIKGGVDQHRIDNEFSAELGRVAGSIAQGDMNLAFEHAMNVNALSKYTSYYKKYAVVMYPPSIVTDLRYMSRQQIVPDNKDKIADVLLELGKDPTNLDLANELISLLQQSRR